MVSLYIFFLMILLYDRKGGNWEAIYMNGCGYSRGAAYPQDYILPHIYLKKILHYCHVLREERCIQVEQTYVSNKLYYFCRIILVFFTALQATHEGNGRIFLNR